MTAIQIIAVVAIIIIVACAVGWVFLNTFLSECDEEEAEAIEDPEVTFSHQFVPNKWVQQHEKVSEMPVLDMPEEIEIHVWQVNDVFFLRIIDKKQLKTVQFFSNTTK